MQNIKDRPTRFGWIAATLPVSDMERALHFYVDVLDFRKVFENGDPVGDVCNLLEPQSAETS